MYAGRWRHFVIAQRKAEASSGKKLGYRVFSLPEIHLLLLADNEMAEAWSYAGFCFGEESSIQALPNVLH